MNITPRFASLAGHGLVAGLNDVSANFAALRIRPYLNPEAQNYPLTSVKKSI